MPAVRRTGARPCCRSSLAERLSWRPNARLVEVRHLPAVLGTSKMLAGRISGQSSPSGRCSGLGRGRAGVCTGGIRRRAPSWSSMSCPSVRPTFRSCRVGTLTLPPRSRPPRPILRVDELAAEAVAELHGVRRAPQSRRRACLRHCGGMSASAGTATALRRRGGPLRSCGRCSGSQAWPLGAATADPACLCLARLCDRPRHHPGVGRRPPTTLTREGAIAGLLAGRRTCPRR